MKYYYLFILIGFTDTHSLSERSELNSDQERQIDCLIITDQYEEKVVINKAIIAGTTYYTGLRCNEVMPMAMSDQFTLPVLKFGIPGKEPEYERDNESLRLGLDTPGNQKAVIHNRSKQLATDYEEKRA